MNFLSRTVIGCSILGQLLFGGTSHHVVKPPRFYNSEHRMQAAAITPSAIDRVYYNSMNAVRVNYNAPIPEATTTTLNSGTTSYRTSRRRGYTPRSYYRKTTYPKTTSSYRADIVPPRVAPAVLPETKAPEPMVDSTAIPKENRAVSLPLAQRYKDAPQIVSSQLEAYNITKISPFRDSTDKVMIESSSGNFAIPIAVLKTVSTSHFTPELLEQWNRLVTP